MRSMRTILARAQFDLPITEEETAAAHKFLDEQTAGRRFTAKLAAAVFAAAWLGVFIVWLNR